MLNRARPQGCSGDPTTVPLNQEGDLPSVGPRDTAAGEDVRILDLPTARRPRELTEIDHDFWLIDDERVVRMHYAADATFVGGELMPADTVASYRAAHEAAWTRADEFTSWWAAHPQYHRVHHHVC